ncbi:gap junction beta-3 protein [Hoplias malabaricus]|uniref:gap junction beta-3 protein n=1 Tax=Hoplias malabaricus TaxID=27720 RepID=UPI00346233E7
MAAIVTGLIPILRTAVDSTTTYKGRTLSFGFLCIRLVTLFLAEMPWFKLDGDFSCNTTHVMCTKACFNKHFDRPVIMAWNFLFVLLIISVVIMELFTAHVRSVFQKRIVRETKGIEVESLGELKSANHPTINSGSVMILDMHGSKYAVFSYIFSLLLRIIVELCFVYVLLIWNLPKLSQNFYICKVENNKCPLVECVVRAAAEKSMSIFALVFISGLVLIVSCLSCLYFIGHHFCNLWTKQSSNHV